MSSPVGPVVPAPPPPPPVEPPPPSSGQFAEKLDALAQQEPAAMSWLRKLDVELAEGEARIHALIEGAKAGKHFTNAELLAMQAGMHQYTLTLDLVSKVTQALVNALRDLLKMQV